MESGVLLGHVVRRQGLQVDSDKIRAILTLVAPKTVREVRGFLGCVGYYRRFIKNYAKVATPLTEFLKRETEFVWTNQRQGAFKNLKRALTTAPILSPPDWEHEFHVTLDTSGWCLGAIFWQYQGDRKEGPIYYASQQMSPAERTTLPRKGEALAVVYACRKFRHYLLGYRFVFHTDHNSLKYLVNELDLSGRIARWILLLQEFNYEVVVNSRKANSNADNLSQQRGLETSPSIKTPFPDEFPNEVFVFHLSEGEPSAYEDVI